MRIKRQFTLVAALMTALALGAAGVAQAINANSTESFNFTKVPKGTIGGTLKQGKLFVHTHTNYTVNGTKTTDAKLYFDKNIAFNPNAVPKCNVAQITGNITMKQAMAACKTKLVGTGTAQANAVNPGDVKGCVLAFNALDANPNRAGNQPGILLFTRLNVIGPISCAGAANNQNGNTTVLLQAPLATNPKKTSPGGPLNAAHYKGGKWLNFADIPQALPLSDFKVTTGKGAPQTHLSGTKANFIRAKCTKRNGPRFADQEVGHEDHLQVQQRQPAAAGAELEARLQVARGALDTQSLPPKGRSERGGRVPPLSCAFSEVPGVTGARCPCSVAVNAEPRDYAQPERG